MKKTVTQAVQGINDLQRRGLLVADLTGKEFQSQTFWQCSLLHSMILISNSEAFVQQTSLPESV